MAEQTETNGTQQDDYEKLIEEFEIQPATVSKLENLGITSLRSFSLLTSDLIDSNLSDISLGQRLLLKAAVEAGSRLRRRQQQQDESMGKSVVPSFTFDSTSQAPGTRYVVSVTTKDNQVVALPVTKETYEKCFMKDAATLAMLTTVATGAVAPTEQGSQRVGVSLMEGSGSPQRPPSKRRESSRHKEAVKRVLEPSPVAMQNEDPMFHWTPTCTNALMLAYIDYMQRGKKPNWDGIVEKIRSKLPPGASVPTHERCRLKIKSQKEKYERLVAINNTPGKKPREIDRLLRAAFDPDAAGEIVVDVSELQTVVTGSGSPKRSRLMHAQ